MPRRSGTTTVWSVASSAASGAHMSPVSPNPCSSTTAGPMPADPGMDRRAVDRDVACGEARGKGLDLGRCGGGGEQSGDEYRHAKSRTILISIPYSASPCRSSRPAVRHGATGWRAPRIISGGRPVRRKAAFLLQKFMLCSHRLIETRETPSMPPAPPRAFGKGARACCLHQLTPNFVKVRSRHADRLRARSRRLVRCHGQCEHWDLSLRRSPRRGRARRHPRPRPARSRPASRPRARCAGRPAPSISGASAWLRPVAPISPSSSGSPTSSMITGSVRPTLAASLAALIRSVTSMIRA